MATPDRQRINEALLRERLGLDVNWLNRDEEGVPHLPESLPSFIRQGRPELGKSVEAAVKRLVLAGCRRQPLYFCLQQLSPEADQSRQAREELAYRRGQENSINEELRNRETKLAAKDDVKLVANHANRALRVIRDYRRELLLANDATGPQLPRGVTIAPSDAGEAISLLLKSLAWVRDLAKSYDAPFETTLLKSKGVLFLTLYVSMFADEKRLKSASEQGKLKGERALRRKKRFAKRDFLPKHILTNIANLCAGGHWAPSDLLAKLQRFEKDYPALHKKMKTNMSALHRAAAE